MRVSKDKVGEMRFFFRSSSKLLHCAHWGLCVCSLIVKNKEIRKSERNLCGRPIGTWVSPSYPVRAAFACGQLGAGAHTSLVTRAWRKSTVQQHHLNVISVCNLQQPYEYFTKHPKEQSNVPLSWHPVKWQFKGTARHSCTSFKMQSQPSTTQTTQ